MKWMNDLTVMGHQQGQYSWLHWCPGTLSKPNGYLTDTGGKWELCPAITHKGVIDNRPTINGLGTPAPSLMSVYMGNFTGT